MPKTHKENNLMMRWNPSACCCPVDNSDAHIGKGVFAGSFKIVTSTILNLASDK